MSKKNKKQKSINFGNRKIIDIIEERSDKHGKIRGRNKQETKDLRNSCTHHKVTKKGKIRGTLQPSDVEGYLYCPKCGKLVSTELATPEMIDENFTETSGLLSQSLYFAQALDAGEGVIRDIAESNIRLMRVKKSVKKLTKMAKKTDNLSDKGKKNKKNVSSATFGSWGD